MNDLSLHILDIVQNSIRANATEIEIYIRESNSQNIYEIIVNDNGSGMDTETLNKVTDPFYTSRTTRKVGLGIPFLKQNAEQSNGGLELKSELNVGTQLKAWFELNNIDKPATGKIVETLKLLITTSTEINVVYNHETDNGKFAISTNDIKEAFEELPINLPEVINAVGELINENLKELKAENE